MVIPEYDCCDYNSCKISSRRDFRKGTQSSSTRTLCTRGTSSENKPYRAALCTESGKPLTIQQLSRKPLSDGQVGHSVNKNIDIFERKAFSDTQVFSAIEQYKLKILFMCQLSTTSTIFSNIGDGQNYILIENISQGSSENSQRWCKLW